MAEQIGYNANKGTATLKTDDGLTYELPLSALSKDDAAKAQNWNNFTAAKILDGMTVALAKIPVPKGTSPTDESIVWEDAKINGQCFIATKGGDNIRLGGITICIYDEKTIIAIDDYSTKWFVITDKAFDLLMNSSDEDAINHLDAVIGMSYQCYKDVKPLYSVETDADGKFTLKKIPKGNFYVFAVASRQTLGKIEHYVWSLKAQDVIGKDPLLLNNENLR